MWPVTSYMYSRTHPSYLPLYPLIAVLTYVPVATRLDVKRPRLKSRVYVRYRSVVGTTTIALERPVVIYKLELGFIEEIILDIKTVTYT